MTATTTAYDYDRQCWVQGPEALALHRRQVADTLAVLHSPKGAEFARLMGRDRTAMLAEFERGAREIK